MFELENCSQIVIIIKFAMDERLNMSKFQLSSSFAKN